MKKINNKILIVALLVLVAILIFSKAYRSPKLQGNLRTEFLKIDTATVTEVRILPADAKGKEIKLIREDNKWWASGGNKKFPADTSSVNNMLKTISLMEADRMVSTRKEKWEAFNVGDNGTQVSVYTHKEEGANIIIGKTGFTRTQGGGFGGAYTYVRLKGENETYVVNGLFESTFNGTFNDWRNKTFLSLPKENISKVVFQYPADTSFVLQKKDTTWWTGDQVADQEKVRNYLDQISSKTIYFFEDEFKPQNAPHAKIQIEGAKGLLATILGWKTDSVWVLNSSQQKNIYFSGKDAGDEILTGVKGFVNSSK